MLVVSEREANYDQEVIVEDNTKEEVKEEAEVPSTQVKLQLVPEEEGIQEDSSEKQASLVEPSSAQKLEEPILADP